jgi:hypothetical protein
MEFYCEDLPQLGVVLVPPSSPEYDRLLADVQRRINHPVAGSPPIPESMQMRISPEDRETSAILLTHSQNGIVAVQQVWTLQETSGRTYTGSIGSGANPSVLLPFGIAGPQALRLLARHFARIKAISERQRRAGRRQQRRAPARARRILEVTGIAINAPAAALSRTPPRVPTVRCNPSCTAGIRDSQLETRMP